MKKIKKEIIYIFICLLSLTAIKTYARFTKTVSKTGTIATADVGYCQINGITSFKECLIRNDSQQTLSLALSTIDTRTSALNLNNIEPVNAYVPKTTYTNYTNKTDSSAIASTSAARFTYVIESKLINPFDADDPDITKITFNPTTGYYTYTGSTTGDYNDIVTTASDIANGVYKYTCLNTTSNGNCTTLYLFTETPYLVSGQYRYKQGYRYSYTVTGTSTSDAGLYKGSDDYTVDSDTYTYFYRGDVNNNWVQFGNYLWRIVRINGDGSVKLIYSGLKTASSHTGTNAQIGTSAFGDTKSFTTTTTDISGLTSDTITTTYSNGRYGPTNVGYMYNPVKVVTTYPNRNPSSSQNLTTFPNFNNISSTTSYYFFKNFNPSADCFTGSGTDDSGACTLKCRTLGNDGDPGVDCVQSQWNTLATTPGNIDKTAAGSTSSNFIYQKSSTDGGYRYTCWGYGTAVKKNNSDGTTSVYITCPVVSEIVGTINNQPTQARVKYHGLFSADANAAKTNVANSKIKTTIDNWYYSNILNKYDKTDDELQPGEVKHLLEEYLTDGIFCNDRTSTSTDFPLVNQNSYTFRPYNRNTATNRVPSFKCLNRDNTFNTNDAFTLKTSGTSSTVTASGIGNNLLTYPVGLITIDEAAYAGGKNGSMNYKYYLYTGQTYWTMSPYNFYASYSGARVWYVHSAGALNYTPSASANGVRPVINLKSGLLYSGGTGTEADPYVVAIPPSE